MAKNLKKQSKGISSIVTERNIMILLTFILLVSVAVLVMKDGRGTKLIDPVSTEQTPTE